MSTARLVTTIRHEFAPIEVEVRYDHEVAKFVCELWDDGMHSEWLDYFTDGEEDALGTAALMLRDYNRTVEGESPFLPRIRDQR